jgi:hypothetical protein
MPGFTSIDHIKRANAESGGHWFSPETLRFFGTRVHSTLYGGRYFVTSEFTGFDRADRAFTVREARPNGHIRTASEFLQYSTRDAAHRAARRLAREA